MRVFLDANVLIDVVQNRIDFIEASSKILQLGLDGECDLCATDITFTSVSYYARKNRTSEYYAALRSGSEYIITRNVRDYPYNDIPAITPIDFLKTMGIE